VRDAAGLLRFAVVRHIVHELVFVEGAAVPPAVEPEFGTDADAPEDPRERGYIAEAEETIRRMRTAMGLLRQAVSLAPYMYADEEYQIKRNAVFSRAVATGHALARCHGRQIVRTIRSRAREHSLDRGLSLSLPYFDDRAMEMRMYDFEVIPPGRTMFAPVFVVLAAHREQDNLDAKESLGPLTRLHLLAELKSLEQAFDTRPR